MIVVWMATVAVVVFVALVVEIINQEHVVKVQLVFTLVSFHHQKFQWKPNVDEHSKSRIDYCSLHLLSRPFLRVCFNLDIVHILPDFPVV